MGYEEMGTRRALGAVLFISAGTNVMDVYSALNSSPWTSENFGADEAKAKSCREYVAHAVVVSSLYCVASGVIAGSWWPVIGAAVLNAYMWFLYNRALKRGAAAGSDGWASGDA